MGLRRSGGCSSQCRRTAPGGRHSPHRASTRFTSMAGKGSSPFFSSLMPRRSRRCRRNLAFRAHCRRRSPPPCHFPRTSTCPTSSATCVWSPASRRSTLPSTAPASPAASTLSATGSMQSMASPRGGSARVRAPLRPLRRAETAVRALTRAHAPFLRRSLAVWRRARYGHRPVRLRPASCLLGPFCLLARHSLLTLDPWLPTAASFCTAAILAVLSHLYPAHRFAFLALMILDLGSHWVQMYRCAGKRLRRITRPVATQPVSTRRFS